MDFCSSKQASERELCLINAGFIANQSSYYFLLILFLIELARYFFKGGGRPLP